MSHEIDKGASTKKDNIWIKLSNRIARFDGKIATRDLLFNNLPQRWMEWNVLKDETFLRMKCLKGWNVR